MTVESAPGVGRADGARTEKVGELMQHAVQTGECPFCGTLSSNEPVFPYDTLKHWRAFYSLSPLPGIARHIMVVPNNHTLRWSDLTREALGEYRQTIQQLQEWFGDTYTTLMRIGNPDYNSATVYHLHAHFMVPGGPVPATEDILQPFSAQLNRLTFDETMALCAELDVLRAADMTTADGRRKALPIRIPAFQSLRNIRYLGGYGAWRATRPIADKKAWSLGIRDRVVLAPFEGADPWGSEAFENLSSMIFGFEVTEPHSFSVIMRHTPDDHHYDIVSSTAKPAHASDVSLEALRFYNELLTTLPPGFNGGPIEFIDQVRQAMLWSAALRESTPERAVLLKLSNWAV